MPPNRIGLINRRMKFSGGSVTVNDKSKIGISREFGRQDLLNDMIRSATNLIIMANRNS